MKWKHVKDLSRVRFRRVVIVQGKSTRHLLPRSYLIFDRLGCELKEALGRESFQKKTITEVVCFVVLRKQHISDADYAHARLVWSSLGCSSLRDYVSLYLQIDVLLLACVFEQFRVACYNYYGLEVLYYVSLPSFSWDSLLRYTRVTLDLITREQQDMYYMIERGLRGGFTTAVRKYVRANHPLTKILSQFNSIKLQSILTNPCMPALQSWTYPKPNFTISTMTI